MKPELFITMILFDSIDDVRALAGADYEKAVIPEDRLPLLARHDARAAHYEVISELASSGPAPA